MSTVHLRSKFHLPTTRTLVISIKTEASESSHG